MFQRKSYMTSREANKVFKQNLRALDETLKGKKIKIKQKEKNRKESKIIDYEQKEFDMNKHKKNKSTFDSTLSFDVKSNFRPCRKIVDIRNCETNLFKNLEFETNLLTKNKTNLSIKSFEQIRKMNPEINFVNDQVDLVSLIGEGI